ncbi:MAG: hypothetical protein U0Y82_02305 [Thermoleophilia bacterium]
MSPRVRLALTLTLTVCAPTTAAASAPLRVPAGRVVRLTATAAPHGGVRPTTCRLTVAPTLGVVHPARRVGPRGEVSWHWRVPLRTRPMRALATVRCGTGVAARRLIVVGRPRMVARLAGVELVQRPTDPGADGMDVAFLIRLRNPRADFDLVGVPARVELLAADGHVVAVRDQLVDRIPGGATMLSGDQVQVLSGAPPVRLRVHVGTADGVYPSTTGAEVRGVQLQRSPDGGRLEVIGQVVNPSFVPMSAGDLTMALRDAQGHLVDVSTVLTSGPLDAGGTLAFDEPFTGAGYAAVTTVEATVDASP